ncbi:MAG: N,N-diacetylchitobiose transport system permease protein, partial [Actinomycetota bacterium]|nr:N,N-diacetylchitobiose transport system permease protein [Actinomycetota bacterium]
AVAPFVWMVLTSVKPEGEILRRTPTLWTAHPQFGRYSDVLHAGFARALRNSLIVATGTTVAGVAVAALAGYALARFDLPLRRYLLLMVMGVQMFPLVVLIIPLFVVMKALGLLDSWLGLVVAYLSFTTPLAVWLLRSFFETIPRDLEEAAMTDGASRFGAMVKVIFPLAGPGLAATAIFSFIAAWNEFLFALTFVKKENLRTLPVALASFVGRSQADWGLIMAASVLFTVPVVLFFLAVHRRLTTGMVAGSVTG